MIIHFDDGREPVYKYRDIFKDFKGSIVWFISTSTIGKKQEGNRYYTPHNYATWDQIRECRDLGWEIGNHSHEHKRFIAMTEEEMIYNIEKSQKIFQDELGEKPTKFAYPFGKFDAKTEEVVMRYFDYRRNTKREDGNYGVYKERPEQLTDKELLIFHSLVEKNPKSCEYKVDELKKLLCMI